MIVGTLTKSLKAPEKQMKASAVLKKARKVLKEKGWCKGALARNKYRHQVDPTSGSAVKFCAFGALHHVMNIPNNKTGWEDYDKITEISAYLRLAIPHNSNVWSCWTIDSYNDHPNITAEDIDRWFADAIKLAKHSEGTGLRK